MRERELAQKKTIRLHGYPFYEDSRNLPGTEAGPFTALFTSKLSFKRYDGRKQCGGYSPDYSIEWKLGEAATQALICLECGEVKMFGPKSELHCDLSMQAHQRLRDLLHPYEKNRPPAKSSP